MKLAGSDDFKIELMKGAADDPALVSIADLGSQSYSPTALNPDDFYYGFRKQLDDDLGQLSAKFIADKEKEKEKTTPIVPNPVDPEKKAAQDKWRKIFANSIEEGKSQGRSEQESMDRAVSLSRVMTPEENAEFKWAFSETTNAPDWKKWGGGRKQGSGKGITNENSPLGLGFSLQQFGRDVTARFSDTQGKVGGGRKNSKTKGGRTAPGGKDGKSQSRGAMRSDIQLKENITFIDKSPAGHSIYEWNYKGEPESNRYQGVMAQELLETAPHAVVTMDDGYLGVKYDEIDVDCKITS